MVSFPPSKINLGLQIVRKRSDGFHDIETCFYPLPFTDILEVISSESFAFSTSGLDIPGDPASNLCVRAFRILQKNGYVNGNVRIHLHKIIPTGGGLGGGSSDAAHVLRLLNHIFELRLSVQQLETFASELGSDCAFFIHDNPMIGSGRGEVLTPVNVSLTGKFLVLLNPGIHVSTAEAFAGVKPASPDITLPEIIGLPIDEWPRVLVNDFEKTVFASYPDIRLLKEKLYEIGAAYAAMSGSGATVFGIFREPVALTNHFEPGSVIWKGFLP